MSRSELARGIAVLLLIVLAFGIVGSIEYRSEAAWQGAWEESLGVEP